VPGPGEWGGPGLPGRVRITKATLQSESIIESDRWGNFIKRAERAGDEVVEEIGRRMQRRARAYAPKRTGKLRRNIKYFISERGGARSVTLGAPKVPYAVVMEKGSRAHAIHGVKANFTWEGGDFEWINFKYGPVGTKRGYANWTGEHGATVWHPGTQPYKFFERAYRDTWPEARQILRETYPGKAR
jgi:Bacteriophage HK97-gp10, putative tail-component